MAARERVMEQHEGYVPGAGRFRREQRTETFRTWHSAHPDMGFGAECLLCGDWSSSHATRESAVAWAAERHPGGCHVVNGCHCHLPHITAAMGLRLGLGASYPRHLARVLFRMAGGVRKYRVPGVDRWGTPHHPLMTWLEARVSDGTADAGERAEYAELAPAHAAWLRQHREPVGLAA